MTVIRIEGGIHRTQRVTFTVDDELTEELDQLIAVRGYQNRAEAIRDLARVGLRKIANDTPPNVPCVGLSPRRRPRQG